MSVTPSSAAGSVPVLPVAPPPLLSLEQVRKWIGPILLFNGIDLEVNRGETVAVLGASRSGKTHLLRASSGLAGITGGRIRLEGVPLSKTRREVRKRIGFMPKPPGRPEASGEGRPPRRAPKAFGVFPRTSVREDLDFFASCLRIPRPRRGALIADVLQLVDLAGVADEEAESLPQKLVAKLFFARVVLHNPDLLLLDDPLPAFSENPAEFWGILEEMKRMGKGVLLTTRDPATLTEGPDRVAVLHAGRIADRGEAGEVLGRVAKAGWPPPPMRFGGIRRARRRRLPPIRSAPPPPAFPAKPAPMAPGVLSPPEDVPGPVFPPVENAPPDSGPGDGREAPDPSNPSDDPHREEK
jgi:ABC-2 type transport system ATP-binding protein